MKSALGEIALSERAGCGGRYAVPQRAEGWQRAMNSRVTILDQLPAPRRHQLKVRSLDELLAAIGDHRLAGQSIVFTNGCFDLLHVGHLRLLEEAAALGDVLIVAVNSDASVKRLKGPARPVVGEAQRAAMLAALECVGGRKKGRKKGPE